MTQAPPVNPAAPGGLGPDQLAELIATFTAATSKLQETHESLRSEVARLEGELRETKGQLARARELAALGEMAAGIAHEIRNPLGSIKLYAKVLVEDLADREQEQSTAQKIARAVDGLNAVVGDALAFSREMRRDTQAMCTRDFAERALECCADRVEMAPIDVELVTGDAPEALADPSLAHQAMVNVVRNACDALIEQGGGRLRISTGERTVLDHDGVRRRMAMVLVEDSGPGIPEDVRSRVFNPFFTTRAAGTGRGRPIVHRILDAHEGRITITNGAPGLGGARVELLFPCAHQHANTDTESQGEAA